MGVNFLLIVTLEYFQLSQNAKMENQFTAIQLVLILISTNIGFIIVPVPVVVVVVYINNSMLFKVKD